MPTDPRTTLPEQEPEQDKQGGDPEATQQIQAEAEQGGEPQEPETEPEAREEQYVEGQQEVDPLSEQAQELAKEGKTRTGLDIVEHASVGVGGDFTIAPGGSVGTGSGPVDAQGFLTEEVDPRTKRNIDQTPAPPPPPEQQQPSPPPDPQTVQPETIPEQEPQPPE